VGQKQSPKLSCLQYNISKAGLFVLTVWLTWSCIVCPGAQAADERVVFQSRDLLVIGQSSAEPTARYLQQLYPKVMAELEQSIGWKLGYRPTVVLVEDRRLFEQMSGSPYVSAYATPREGALTINLQAVSSQVYVLNETFKHELCHLVLHDHIRRSHIHKWLDEGVCQWVSGSVGELLINSKDFAAGAIDLSRHAFPLRLLAHRFPEDKHALFLAYEESRQFVDYITAQYGRQALLNILKAMEAGDETNEAVFKSLSKPLDSIEVEWFKQLKRRDIWVIWIGQYLYEILFFAAACLSIAAFIKLRIKRRRYLEEESEEEPSSDD